MLVTFSQVFLKFFVSPTKFVRSTYESVNWTPVARISEDDGQNRKTTLIQRHQIHVEMVTLKQRGIRSLWRRNQISTKIRRWFYVTWPLG